MTTEVAGTNSFGGDTNDLDYLTACADEDRQSAVYRDEAQFLDDVQRLMEAIRNADDPGAAERILARLGRAEQERDEARDKAASLLSAYNECAAERDALKAVYVAAGEASLAQREYRNLDPAEYNCFVDAFCAAHDHATEVLEGGRQ